jgi:hypothetical protein
MCANGTPTSNTMVEMYTMLRYLGPKFLVEPGRTSTPGGEFRGVCRGPYFKDDVVLDQSGIERMVEYRPCSCSSPGGTWAW